MADFLSVALGGACGAAARFGVNQAALFLGLPLLYATFLVNVLGSFLLGFLAVFLPVSDTRRLVLVIGFLGSFTTFSTFAGEAVELWRQGRPVLMAMHIAAHNGIAIAAVGAGWRLACVMVKN